MLSLDSGEEEAAGGGENVESNQVSTAFVRHCMLDMKTCCASSQVAAAAMDRGEADGTREQLQCNGLLVSFYFYIKSWRGRTTRLLHWTRAR